ncbi:MAG: DNA mismatch repair endonuclease MutL [Haliscomenobacter sp.]|uniref:DNA mismatch repair endonuclease MutL n=1 Tax=Haliscomenobacter sp. TaxID=2717303 RepID=UPI0029A636F3|nr:DNA mismatch repair endonuclease MutL [Haliscomenobacter sp.]MDX2069084.1 DNA mismatch repair endonuclease MutL [Haliscomenobacter sp.]
MADVIQLLPDSIANQIAAGEVIQRPASVVKELMENAVDAGSKNIKLIVKDAGRTLIQVIDDGCGMSETDARMSFERHATSKIRSADDLFAIRTMGFRGEALASIASVAQVELRTRRHASEMGTLLHAEGSRVKSQEPCQTAAGTSFSVKNLFYNVPARRNFLKANTVEFRHILDEFERVVLANPDIFFSLHHNGSEVFHLPPGNLRQRITGVFGNAINTRLVPVNEDTDVIQIKGFVGKPEFAKKVRGEQYFFVNSRFIKSSYLHHAVMSAYEEVLPKEMYPFYLLFLDIDPARIDVNVHPTKQEIKFEDDRLVYNYLKVAVRHGLGQYGVMPSLDFEQESGLKLPYITAKQEQDKPFITPARNSGAWQNDDAKTFSTGRDNDPAQRREDNNLRNWQLLYKDLGGADEEPEETVNSESEQENTQTLTIGSSWELEETTLGTGTDEAFAKQHKAPYQLQGTYIVSQIKSGYMLIDQQSAHERILYEQYLSRMETRQGSTQQQLFPITLNFSPNDATLLKDLLSEIQPLGFDVQEFGVNSFVVNGLPAELAGKQSERSILESLLEQHKIGLELQLNTRESLARSMARSAAIKRGQLLNEVEMQALIDQLFACAMPFRSPFGKKCFVTYELEDLQKQFE